MIFQEDSDDLVLLKLNKRASSRKMRICAQYACEVLEYSSQYASDRSISYAACNIIGRPVNYPNCGDSTSCFQLKTYGKWWEISPSSLKSKKVILPVGTDIESQDFVEFKVFDPVVPHMLRVYEVYNPGAIVKILGYCNEVKKWIVIWHGKPQWFEESNTNIFHVNFTDVGFKTNIYRLEFHHRHLNYYTELDSICLFGEMELSFSFVKHILSRDFNKKDVFCSTTECINSSSKDTTSCFDLLPEEILQLIMSYLDLQSLCRCSRVCKLFKRICYDPTLYQHLNLKLYWHQVTDSTLSGLHSRLTAMKRLNLSWCGGGSAISDVGFKEFVETNCQFLVRLQISSCPFVTQDSILAIATACPSLEELQMKNCKNVSPTGLGYISMMSKLKYLDVERTLMDSFTIVKILKNVKLEHLMMGCCNNLYDYNDICKTIGQYLGSSFKSLDVCRGVSMTCQGVNHLAANCPNLLELDIGWCHYVNPACGCVHNLVKNCPKLKKLFMSAVRSLSNKDLNAIAKYCRDLEQLDILGATLISTQSVKNILESCPKLKLLDVSFTTIKNSIPELRNAYPNVQIKYCLYQPFSFVP